MKIRYKAATPYQTKGNKPNTPISEADKLKIGSNKPQKEIYKKIKV